MQLFLNSQQDYYIIVNNIPLILVNESLSPKKRVAKIKVTKGNVAINGTIDASPDFRAQKYNNCPKKAAHIPSKAMKTQLDKLTSVRGLISVLNNNQTS